MTFAGSILASGETGTENSGGGSGGTLIITAQDLSGHGLMESNGGSSERLGGGGSGGKIAMFLANRYALNESFLKSVQN